MEYKHNYVNLGSTILNIKIFINIIIIIIIIKYMKW